MKTLSIDIETYSGYDLQKCGVYKYSEAPDFEILLFGYSVDGGEVQVIDLTAGEAVPPDILDALTDDGVIKWAFNANFERVCLSRHLRDIGISLDPFADNHHSATVLGKAKYLNPESWRCSMVWSAYMGMLLSLEGSGAVLGLEKQKLTEGKELIRYFCSPCKPTAVNGQRTRNLSEHAPEKWAAFKAYNKRDVEAEMSIQTKLAKFPVPDSVWEDYRLDQEIKPCTTTFGTSTGCTAPHSRRWSVSGTASKRVTKCHSRSARPRGITIMQAEYPNTKPRGRKPGGAFFTPRNGGA